MQPVGVVQVTGDRRCYPCSDDRLITDYHVTMVGYGKKIEFHIPSGMECRHGLAMRILSVRMSVRLSVYQTRDL